MKSLIKGFVLLFSTATSIYAEQTVVIEQAFYNRVNGNEIRGHRDKNVIEVSKARLFNASGIETGSDGKTYSESFSTTGRHQLAYRQVLIVGDHVARIEIVVTDRYISPAEVGNKNGESSNIITLVRSASGWRAVSEKIEFSGKHTLEFKAGGSTH